MPITDDVKQTVVVLKRAIENLEKEQSEKQEAIRQLQNQINGAEAQNVQLSAQIEANSVLITRSWEQIKKAQARILSIDTDLRAIADHLDKIVP